MKKKTFLGTVIMILGGSLVGLVPHNAASLDVSTNTRPWLEESEFAIDLLLHATRHQTVVLNLESRRDGTGVPGDFFEPGGGGWGPIRDNRFRFLVDEPQKFSFCIPEDEPSIVLLTIKENRDGLYQRGRIVMRSRPGGPCDPVSFTPGSYTVDIYHDSRTIPPGGRKAFLYRPARRRHLRSQSPVGETHGGTLQELLRYPNFFALSAGTNSVGKVYPHSDSSTNPPRMSLSGNSNGVLDEFVWSFYDTTTDFPQFTNSRPMAPWLPQATWEKGFAPLTITPFVNGVPENAPYVLRFHDRDCPSNFNDKISYYCAPGFILNDQGDGTYTMWADILINNVFPWVDGQSGSPANLVPVIVSAISGNTPDPNHLVWDFTFIGYADTTTMPELQEGEFALYGQCNYQGTAFVFDGNVNYDQFSGITNQEIRPPASIKSIKLGPSTYLEMFKGGQDAINIGADVTCASESIEPDQINVFIDVLKFIAATKSCINCNLAGIDFSGEDFTGVDFSGVILTGANLADTNLTGTNLTDADLDTITGENGSALSGAVFTGATLGCTSFKGSTLTNATFVNNVVKTDYSCYVDLSGTTLGFDTLDTAQWRYFDLSSATIINDTGTTPVTLSTLADPLDLSGAILSRATGLSGVILDEAELGCATPDATEKNCTQLIDTDLSKASLKKAILVGAALNGANLSFANLTEANLQGAQLLKSPTTQVSANLEGVLLKNANLSQADLSGANLSNANWFSSFEGPCPGSTWAGKCASGEGATLNSTNFEGGYLNGLDLSGAKPQGANFTGALLVGDNFTGANLSNDPSSGVATTFAKAFLQGANFTDAFTAGANFTSAYVDLSSGGTLLFQLPTDNLDFTGFASSGGSIAGCVEFTYSSMTTLPATDSGNICPDANNGPCSNDQWGNPIFPISQALPPSTSDTTTGLPNGCTGATQDINWILQ